MAYYRGYSDPAEQYAGTSFDPYTGRLNAGQLVAQFMARMAAEKQRKQAEQWEVEDRDLNKRVKEAQIRNYDETAPPKEAKPTSKVTPAAVKNMMKRLDYPDEVIAEVDSMNEPALAASWAKVQTDFAARQQAGMRVPRTASTPRGKLQQAQLKSALDVVKGRKTRFNDALSRLYANPEKSILSEGRIAEYEKALDEIERQEGEIASMMNNIDESGELTEQQFMRLNTILKFKMSYNPYRPKPKTGTDAEKKLPPGFTIEQR